MNADVCHRDHSVPTCWFSSFFGLMKIVEILVEGIGADRIQWGTDWPYLGQQPYPNVIRAIQEAPFLSNEDSEKILSLNAVRFLQS